MSFETDIPQHIERCELQIKHLQRKLVDIDWPQDGHECDCEYCDRQGEDASEGDPEAEQKGAAINAEIDEVKHTIASLKAHAAVHKVRLDSTKVRHI